MNRSFIQIYWGFFISKVNLLECDIFYSLRKRDSSKSYRQVKLELSKLIYFVFHQVWISIIAIVWRTW